MAYLGIALAFVFLYHSFKVALTPHDTTVTSNPFTQIYSGAIFGVALILACVGPFVLFGAQWPAMPLLILVVVASVVVIVLYYGLATRNRNIVSQ